MTEEQLREMANQLSCPQGERGLQTGEIMNEVNVGMTSAAIDALEIADGNEVLELGHGNCAHLGKILQKAENIHYTGLEISETMHAEAKSKNEAHIAAGQAAYHLYEGESIPFEDDTFDRIMTVNTIYFWKDPAALLREIHRVLKPGGIFALTFAQRDFMQHLPFTKYRFRLYNDADIIELMGETDFQLVDMIGKTEQVRSNAGETVSRDFSVAKMRKRSQGYRT